MIFLAFVILNFTVGEAYSVEAEKKVEAKAEVEKKAEANVEAKKVETKELTKEETVAQLKNIFQYNADAVQAVGGLEVKTDASGTYYLYKGKKLEELDKETLTNILRSANNFLSFKRMQQTQKQLKGLKQIEDLNRTQRMLKQQNQSRTYKVPSVPKTRR